MLGLIKKEIYEKSGFLFSMMIGILAIATAPFIVTQMEGGAGFAGTFSMMFLPFAYLLLDFMDNIFVADETKTAAYFWGSTPNGKEGVIGAKYLIILMACLIITLYIYVEALIFDEVTKIMGVTLAVAVIHLFFKSIELPFVFIFGAKHGMYIKTFFVIVILFMLLGYGLFGYIPENLSFESFLDWINNALLDGSFINKLKVIGVIAGGVTIALYFISYKISCMGYWHGVEEYEC